MLHGPAFRLFVWDVVELATRESGVARVQAILGPVGMLVNNTGILAADEARFINGITLSINGGKYLA